MTAHKEFAKGTCRTLQETMKTNFSGLFKTKIKIFGLNAKEKKGHAHPLANIIPAVKHGGGTIMLFCTETSLLKMTCPRVRWTLNWVEGLSSNRKMTVSNQPRSERSGFGTTLWMSLSDPASSEAWTWLNISGEFWKWLCTDSPLPSWCCLRRMEET